MNVSRAIEHNLDREEYDFSLEVASAGVGSPLLNSRQFIKNIGRKLQVDLEDKNPIEGTLTAADNQAFTLEWKQRESKPLGKGKVTVTKQRTLSYADINTAKVLVK